jgi:hypothetical protein
MERGRPAAQLQPARQNTLAAAATLDARLHGGPDRIQSVAHLLRFAPGLLVRLHHAADRQS